jgi:hypothetical protein
VQHYTRCNAGRILITVALIVVVLNAVYEEDFLGFAYGFGPGRG